MEASLVMDTLENSVLLSVWAISGIKTTFSIIGASNKQSVRCLMSLRVQKKSNILFNNNPDWYSLFKCSGSSDEFSCSGIESLGQKTTPDLWPLGICVGIIQVEATSLHDTHGLRVAWLYSQDVAGENSINILTDTFTNKGDLMNEGRAMLSISSAPGTCHLCLLCDLKM